MRRGTTVHLWLALVVACAGLALAACSDDAKKKPNGDPCEHNTDCEDDICHVGVCASKSPGKLGDACALDAECRSFNCVNNVCAAGTRANGDHCRYNVECASGVCQIEGSLPGLCVKDASNPDGAVPDAAPDAGVDQALPDAALPDAVLPDKALPDAVLPDKALPDNALPDMPPPDVGPCGNKNEPCCGGLCNGTLACVGGTCVCGAKDQPCCNGSVCDANLTCNSSTKLCTCGALQQACCNGTTCNSNLFCAGKACACIKVLDGSFFIRTDGTIWQQNLPSSNKAIGGLSGMTELMAAGYYHACGLKSDGTVWCWSRSTYYGNLHGQLADGTFVTPPATDIPSQVKVASSTYLTGVTGISGTGSWGGYNSTTCAVKSDKTVWCWGNDQGGLFQETSSTSTDKAYATQIKASATTMLTGATQVAVNYRHACAVMGSNMACWGHNGFGQLGAGDSTARQYPVLISIPGKTVKKVSASIDFNCALTTTGEVYCWGKNSDGQCGQGYPSTAVASPGQVAQSGGGKLTGVKEIAAGNEMACAVKTDGSLWCWGKWPSSNHSATQMKDQSSVLINDATLVTTVNHNYRILRTNGDYYQGGSTGKLTYSCP